MKYFVTGVAGFIGFHVARRLLDDGHEVHGFDALTEYYDPELKRARIEQLSAFSSFSWTMGHLEDVPSLRAAIETSAASTWVHLAAQAGVRYSLDSPDTYISANIVGTHNLLEAARYYKPKHLMLASTSSVYGGNVKIPFSEQDGSHLPMSLYAATKKATEVLSHSYAHLFEVPTTCFRFFTVYGPWGRPDMALFKFVDAIRRGESIDVYGRGEMTRDFTYIDDLVDAVIRLSDVVPSRGNPVSATPDSLSPIAPWRVVNIGGGSPVGLMDFIAAVESATGTEARKNYLPMQPGDVVTTTADPSLLEALIGSTPETPIQAGVRAFVEWYDAYRGDHG